MSVKQNILIVDDEPEIGKLLHLILEDDFNVEVFNDPRRACERIKDFKFDLVISDVKMPFINGFDVLKHTKNVWPEISVLLITGHAQTPEETKLATSLGASKVLFKPFGDLGGILDLIKDLINGQSGSNSPAPKATQVPTSATISPNQGTASKMTTSVKTDNGKKRRIMALDDERDLIEVISILLEDQYEIKLFSDPKIAIEDHRKCAFDLIMTDLNMPEMSGLTFIQKIREFDKTTPIIVMSGHGPEEDEVQSALKAGGNSLLAKPFPEVQEVESIIRKLLPQ